MCPACLTLGAALASGSVATAITVRRWRRSDGRRKFWGNLPADVEKPAAAAAEDENA